MSGAVVTDSDEDSVAHDAGSIFDGQDDYQRDSCDSEDENDAANFDWSKSFIDDVEEFPPQLNSINVELGINADTTPLEILENFLRDDMLQKICQESSRYAQQKQMKNFKHFELSELWRFLAVHFTMGLVKKSSIKEYWSTNHIMHTPFFNNTMPRDRYVMILRSLHFMNNEEIPADNTDKFIKLGDFMEKLTQNFKAAVKVGEYLCLDESLVPFKGRLSIKQYNPKKRSRFGVKLFVLADCSSRLILDILPYQGATTKLKDPAAVQTMGFDGAAVVTLVDPYLNNGHRLVVDNYFNSPTLARYLKQKNTYILGTVQKRRKGMPKSTEMTRKLKPGDIRTFSDGSILIERWLDRRDICMLNTFLPHSMIDADTQNPRNCRKKPGSVLLYNSKMGMVDNSDKVTAPHASVRKSKKWYRKVVFHMMDIAIFNSLQLYCQLRSVKISYVDFVKILVQNIIDKHPKPQSLPRGRPPSIRNETRLNGIHYPIETKRIKDIPGRGQVETKIRSNCVYCHKVHGKRKQVVFRCNNPLCKKPLCVGAENSCFIRYHSEPIIKKRRILQESNPTVLDSEEVLFQSSQEF